MIELGNCETETIEEDGEFIVWRVKGAAGTSPRLIVSPALERASASIGKLEHAYALRGELHSSWAARPLELVKFRGRPALLVEDPGGEFLDRLIGTPTVVPVLLRVAIGLTKALGGLHARGLIHRDFKPANTIVDTATGEAWLTGFGLTSHLPRHRQSPEPPEVIVGTLAYMAPEQTGRMNRSMDARSDLYSLGVTLYELFTGTLPFTASDPMEWIHCHIARQPLSLSKRVDGLLPAIDRVVLKLLAKNPEDRYRTAAGVETDLRKCLEIWMAEEVRGTFELGERDVSDRLLIPEKLYGRDLEIEVLLAASKRVLTRGTSEMVFVSGNSGIGKSSFVNELHKVLVPRRGLFAAGKFDQYKRDIPYATLAQAFQSLVRQLLNKNDAELGRWRDELHSALGPNGQLMVNLIPELALIIGEQPPVLQVDPQAAQARFHLVFRSFLGVFAKPEHPLVLFIDDLQWLDTGTLELLERLVTDSEVRDIMVIGAYRDDEVDQAHPLCRTIAAIRHAGGAVSEIILDPLEVGHLAQLCADALNTNVERTGQLAELVHEKTAGNPFFAIQFITTLAEERLLNFDSGNFAWQWDIGEIRAKSITENVAHLISAKLSRLPHDAQETLGQLACLGNVGDVRTLALVRGSSEDQVYGSLRDAVEAGLVIHLKGSFAFMHDRVQEASYALIPRSERPEAHLRIARVILSLTPSAELRESIFEIVSQFERGSSAIVSLSEREQVAGLNLMAGKRAMSSSAYASAQAYFAAGRALLGESTWEDQYRLTFDLERHRAECEIVIGELGIAEGRLGTLSRRAIGFADQADIVCLALLLYFTTGKSERAVEVALGFLSSVGISWPSRPTESEVRQEYLEMQRRLARQPMEALIDLPAMSDPGCIATMAVLTELFPAAYAVDRYLLELVLLRMTNLSLEHGHCDSSSVAYSALNMALGSHFADYTSAYGLGQLACELVDRRGADRYKARVYSCFAAFTMPWIKHIPLCQPMMTQAFEVGRSMGDIAFAAYNSRNLITHLLVSGVPLDQVQREAEQAIAFAKGVQLGMPTEKFFGQLELVQKLRDVFTEHLFVDEDWATQNVEEQPGLAMMVCYHWVFRLQERFFAADFRSALEAAARVEGILWTMRSSIEEADYEFYAALTCAAVCDKASGEQRERYLRTLWQHYERIVVWAGNCPENFANRQALVGAEIARLEGREIEAQNLYEKAVQLAREHGFVQNEGLANELAGQFYVTRGLETIADAYLRNARGCYERWGALSKLKQLDVRYPHLRAYMLPGSSTATIDAPVAQLDVEAVDKASQTLSSEMVLPSLLEKLVRLAVEHAGAERGMLILLHGKEPYIEADATTAGGSVEVTVRSYRVRSSDLPQSALHYVLRTHERIVLDDASAEGLDPEDEYVRRNRPRSVLCLPIFKQTKVIGALYLENNLTTHAFNSDRVAVLDFLASQAAIWLENARLYSDLQRSEAWLREAQHLSSTGSWYWHVASDSLDFSEEACRIYELDPGQTVTIAMVMARIHPEDLPLAQEMVDIAHGPATDLDYHYRAQMPDLSVKYLHLVAHGTRDKDGQLGYIGAIQDVTQRHLAEEALGKTRSELAHVARVTTLGALTASIAHEVSQPLSGIVTNSSTCLRMLSADPPNVVGAMETVRRMIRDGLRASDVITRLRALFGNKGSTNEPVDLNDAAREVIALSRNELQRNSIILRTEFAADLLPVIGDRVQLEQVILNLILNASDAMGEVDAQSRQLVIRTTQEESGGVRLSVQDSGKGLDPQNLDRLFEAFYTTKPNGMGMGLSVSRSIIESHHGSLWAAANEGPGATFSFSVPYEPERVTPPGLDATPKLNEVPEGAVQ